MKKGKGAVVLVVAAVMITLCAGTIFAYPYIENVLSPKTQVLFALKDAFSDSSSSAATCKEQVRKLLTEQTNIYGNGTVSAFVVNDRDYRKETEYHNAAFGVLLDAKKRTVTGNAGVKNASGTKKREAEIAADTRQLSIAENETKEQYLLREVAKEAGLLPEYDRALRVLDSVDADTLQEYFQVSDKFMAYAKTAADTVLDKSIYTKGEDGTYTVAGNVVHATRYTVTIPKEALQQAAETYVNQVYADTELLSYMTMIATYTGYSQKDYKDRIEEHLAEYTGVDVFVYLNDRKKLTAIETAFDTGFCALRLAASGTDKWNETMVFTMESEESTYALSVSQKDAVVAYDADLRYHGKTMTGNYALLTVNAEIQEQAITCKKMDVQVKKEKDTLKLSVSGDAMYEFAGK